MKSSWKKFANCLIVLPLVSCISTGNLRDNQLDVSDKLRNGDYLAAKENLNKELYRDEDKILYYIDDGMINFYAGANQESNAALQQADYLNEDLYQQTVGKQISAVITNDNALSYQAEDFEDIYINIFGALNYARMLNIEDARVEIRRLQEKLVLLEDRYRDEIEAFIEESGWDGAQQLDSELPFHDSALSRYLSMIIERADGARDDWRISLKEFQAVFSKQQNIYSFPMPTLPVYRRQGLLPVNIMAFTGFAPVKYAESVSIIRVPGGLAVQTEDDNKLALPFAIPLPDSLESSEFRLYRFEMPKLRKRSSTITKIVVHYGEQQQQLELLEDISQVAMTSFAAKWPLLVSRTVLRVILKVLINEVTSLTFQNIGNTAGNNGLSLIGKLTGAIGSLVVTGSESSDLRGSGFFPDKCYTTELWLPAGKHHLKIDYYQNDNLLYRHDLGVKDINTNFNIFPSFNFN